MCPVRVFWRHVGGHVTVHPSGVVWCEVQVFPRLVRMIFLFIFSSPEDTCVILQQMFRSSHTLHLAIRHWFHIESVFTTNACLKHFEFLIIGKMRYFVRDMCFPNVICWLSFR